MANKPFDYTIINPLERPTSSDINQLQAQAHYDSRVLANQLFAGEEGFLGDSFKAIPYPFPAEGFSLTSGVLYSQGTAEDNIGAVVGLSDSYTYKATYLGYRAISAPAPPTTSGYVRYDMLAIRPLSGTERMVDPAVIGKFNPSLKSFTGQEVPKTLTASLDGFVVQENIPYTETGTYPFVYKTGLEIPYPGNWNLVAKPAPDAGYFAVVYIRRFEGQTEINTSVLEDARTILTIPSENIGTIPAGKGGTGQTSLPSGEILLGNGTSPITSTAVLPVSKGGTGNSSISAPTGSVAWFNNALDKIEYTQAVTGLYDTPASGYLLSSNSSGAPTWIAPGAAGQVLVSTGTAWEASDLPGGGTSYLTSGTHTISASANFVEITCIGGGGGGGGGARSDIGGEEGCGGAGGGGAGITRILYSAANLRTLGTALTITVGAGGAGGAGASAVNTDGSNGADGAVSLVRIGTSQLARATGGAAGIGGKASNVQTAAGGDGGLGTLESGTTGGTGTSPTELADSASSNIGAATGGGAGGGYDNPYPLSGGTSGFSGLFTRYLDGASGGGPGSPGSAGTSTSFGIAGTGGGGGGADAGSSGGAGGAGGAGGGGGGGGGYCRMTTVATGSGGNGGNGGNGRVIIREW